MKCTNCGKENDPKEKFCVECGQLLQAVAQNGQTSPPSISVAPAPVPTKGEVECPTCHKMNPVGQAFCAECGAQLSQVPVPPAPQPTELKCPTCGTINPPGAKFAIKMARL